MNRLLVRLAVTAPLALGLMAGCASSTTPDKPAVDTLEAPLEGEGFQFGTQLFSVAAGDEVQDCYFFRVRDLAAQGGLDPSQPVNLHRVQLAQKAGSHHMNIFRVNTIGKLDPANGTYQHGINGTGECFKSPNWADWPLVANTQQAGDLDWTFPDGVANVFSPDEWLMLQTHYVNATSQATPEGAEVKVNFHTIPKEQVQHEMGTLFATKQSIRVCKSNPTPTFSGTCQIKSGQPINIVAANGHFHSRGTNFDILAWDGTSVDRPSPDKLFYHSDRWSDPPMLHDLTTQLPPNAGVFFSCSYQWTPPTDAAGGCAALDAYDKSKHSDATPDCCYDFGPIVEKNEHCNAFVYYWPKAEQKDVFCN